MGALEGTVTLPGMGAVKKKYVAIAAGGIAVVVLYAYWRASRAVAPAAEPAAVEEAYEDPYTVPGKLTSPTTQPGEVITNNAQWTIRAVEALTEVGYDPLVASLALARYLARQELTAVQADIVRTALALVGDPPVGVYVIIVGTAGPGPDPDPDEDPDPDPGTPTTPGREPNLDPVRTEPVDNGGNNWDGVPAPRPGPVGQHGYVVPVNDGVNPIKVVWYWMKNGGAALKRAQPVGNRVGDNSAYTITGPPGKPGPDGPPGYIKGK